MSFAKQILFTQLWQKLCRGGDSVYHPSPSNSRSPPAWCSYTNSQVSVIILKFMTDFSLSLSVPIAIFQNQILIIYLLGRFGLLSKKRLFLNLVAVLINYILREKVMLCQAVLLSIFVGINGKYHTTWAIFVFINGKLTNFTSNLTGQF